MNLSGACIDAMIEIFKNESSNLNFLIRDCKEKKPFQNTLLLLFNEYFTKPRLNQEKSKNVITASNKNINIKIMNL
jgi:hypothetical protein